MNIPYPKEHLVKLSNGFVLNKELARRIVVLLIEYAEAGKIEEIRNFITHPAQKTTLNLLCSLGINGLLTQKNELKKEVGIFLKLAFSEFEKTGKLIDPIVDQNYENIQADETRLPQKKTVRGCE